MTKSLVDSGQFIGVGFSLQADGEFLNLTRPIIENDAEYFEVSPEMLWRPTRAGLVPNRYHELFLDLKKRSGRPFVAHGLMASLGSNPNDLEEGSRFSSWLQALRETHEVFDFEWFSDHLGWIFAQGHNPIFPLPMPMTEESALRVADRLMAIAKVIPTTAFENPADSFRFGPNHHPGPFWRRICEAGNSHLMLDLHNLYTESVNLGFSLEETLRLIPWERVVQIHLSGGSDSESDWLASGRVFRLDSHDNAVPEEVWQLLERALPFCSTLRGVLLERLPGTIDTGDLPILRAEMQRAKALVAEAVMSKDIGSKLESQDKLTAGGNLTALQNAVVKVIANADSYDNLNKAHESSELIPYLEHIDADGFEITSLIVRKLRFEMLCGVDGNFAAEFDEAPDVLMEVFEAYAHAVPRKFQWPNQDAAAFWSWRAQNSEAPGA